MAAVTAGAATEEAGVAATEEEAGVMDGGTAGGEGTT